jgi:hypothetical protein
LTAAALEVGVVGGFLADGGCVHSLSQHEGAAKVNDGLGGLPQLLVHL